MSAGWQHIGVGTWMRTSDSGLEIENRWNRRLWQLGFGFYLSSLVASVIVSQHSAITGLLVMLPAGTIGMMGPVAFALARGSDRSVTQLRRRFELRASDSIAMVIDGRPLQVDEMVDVQVCSSRERLEGYTATTFHLLIVLRDEASLLATSGQPEPVTAGALALSRVLGRPCREHQHVQGSFTPMGAAMWSVLFGVIAAVASVLLAMIPILWSTWTPAAIVSAVAIALLHGLLPWPLIALTRESYRRMFVRHFGSRHTRQATS